MSDNAGCVWLVAICAATFLLLCALTVVGAWLSECPS